MPIRAPAGALTTTFDDTLRFYLNGTRVVLDEIDPEVTLLEYLRGIGLTGTKLYAHALNLSPSRSQRY
jgi:xanthine dehydrogenase/oxidase